MSTATQVEKTNHELGITNLHLEQISVILSRLADTVLARYIDDEKLAADVEVVGQVLDPVLTGPLTISGPGLPTSGGHVRGLVSQLSSKVGEDGYICTLYLGEGAVQSIAAHYGDPGSNATVSVSFSLSLKQRERPTTSPST